MNNKNSTQTAQALAAQGNAIDAFMALTNIYFAGTERLSALTLSAARETVEDCVSMGRNAAEAGAADDSAGLQSALGRRAFERALTYSRSTVEIVTEAHRDAVQVVMRQFPLAYMGFPLSGDASAGFDLMTKGFRELTSMATAHVAAAAEAGSKLTAEAQRAAKKVA